MKKLSSFMVVPLFLVNNSLHVSSLQWKKRYKYLKTKYCLIYPESEKSLIQLNFFLKQSKNNYTVCFSYKNLVI